MSDPQIPLNHDALATLLGDPVMNRIVLVVNTVNLSILELLEYGFSRRDINRAIAHGVIEFAKSPSPPQTEITGKGDVIPPIPQARDYYFEVLSSKIRLTALGLYILEILGSEEQSAEPEEESEVSPIRSPAPQL